MSRQASRHSTKLTSTTTTLGMNQRYSQNPLSLSLNTLPNIPPSIPTPTPISMAHNHHNHLHHHPSNSHPTSQSRSHFPSPTAAASEIIPRLYISDLTTAESPIALRALGVTHVLSSMRGTVHVPANMGLVRMQVPLEDMPFAELAAYLPGTCEWLFQAMYSASPAVTSSSNPNNPMTAAGNNNIVLVHCAEGISRSASVVAAFLMRLYGWTPAQALAHIRAKRRCADPNFGFVRQLGEFQELLNKNGGNR